MKKTFRIDVNVPKFGYSLAVKIDGTESDAVDAALNHNLFCEESDANCCNVEDITDDAYEMWHWERIAHEF